LWIQFLSFSIFISCGVMREFIIVPHIVLIVDLDYCSGTLENIFLLGFVRIFGLNDVIKFFVQI